MSLRKFVMYNFSDRFMPGQLFDVSCEHRRLILHTLFGNAELAEATTVQYTQPIRRAARSPRILFLPHHPPSHQYEPCWLELRPWGGRSAQSL